MKKHLVDLTDVSIVKGDQYFEFDEPSDDFWLSVDCYSETYVMLDLDTEKGPIPLGKADRSVRYHVVGQYVRGIHARIGSDEAIWLRVAVKVGRKGETLDPTPIAVSEPYFGSESMEMKLNRMLDARLAAMGKAPPQRGTLYHDYDDMEDGHDPEFGKGYAVDPATEAELDAALQARRDSHNRSDGSRGVQRDSEPPLRQPRDKRERVDADDTDPGREDPATD